VGAEAIEAAEAEAAREDEVGNGLWLIYPQGVDYGYEIRTLPFRLSYPDPAGSGYYRTQPLMKET
jgi:hypothetical protein